jgi:Protein of unknown function (DUF1622)
LLGLEFLIAADIIHTVLTPTLADLAILGAIVAIRTVISFSINWELRQVSAMKSEAARALDLTDWRSLLALRGIGLEFEAEIVRLHGRGVIALRGHGAREHVSHRDPLKDPYLAFYPFENPFPDSLAALDSIS